MHVEVQSPSKRGAEVREKPENVGAVKMKTATRAIAVGYDHVRVRVNNTDFFSHLRPVYVRPSVMYVRHVQPVYVWPRAAGLCLATCGRFIFGHVRPVYVRPHAASSCRPCEVGRAPGAMSERLEYPVKERAQGLVKRGLRDRF